MNDSKEQIANQEQANVQLPVFMGVCQNVLARGNGVLLDLYGMGDIIPLTVFPCKLTGVNLLLGFHRNGPMEGLKVTVRNREMPEMAAWSDIKVGFSVPPEQMVIGGYAKPYEISEIAEGRDHISGILLWTPEDYVYKLMPIPCPPLLVLEPSTIDVFVTTFGQEHKIGTFRCEFAQPPPISAEERAALMSRPGAAKVFNLVLQCKECKKKKGFYVLLDPNGKVPEGFEKETSLADAPEFWLCDCGKAKVPLTYAKRGLHHVFRTESLLGEHKDLQFRPMYEKGAIAAILSGYQRILVEKSDSEEAIQKFLENNPILWNFLGPMRIWNKPPILSRYNADFAILNRQKILYWVEIETPSTKLIKAKRGIHSELQAGLDQIRDWKIEIDRRREAVLDGLKLTQRDVHHIRYILVAGMSSGTSAEGLERIRSMRTDADSILCFDELASFLHSTETALLNI